MVNEVLECLRISPGSWYLDATLGGGGHTKALLAKGGNVLGLDHDQRVISSLTQELSQPIKSGQLIVKYGNFANLLDLAKDTGKIYSGVLFDLGMSSLQLEQNRGFSFTDETSLDMRMDTTLGVTALDLVNALSEKELKLLLTHYGEEPYATRIAKHIVSVRARKPIRSARELADFVSQVVPRSRLHPATRVFQALRIAVNDELNNLRCGLPQAIELVRYSGRIVAISFHSLEDRIVKESFRESEQKGLAVRITDKPLTPSLEEIELNPRSRSAKLRILEKKLGEA